ncbi:MAG: cyclic nucleotide-binding domain-containing protein [Chrysiogenetes bacterium]|nr:cyclic nucleotide-binding domain-containing protein [Chrysiogenetes bacterium]
MQIEVLGCHSGSIQDARPPTLRFGESVLFDAGSASAGLSVTDQYKIDHIFLTSAHLESYQDIGFLADNVIGQRQGPVRVHASQANLDVLFRDFFNDKVWPDFTKIPTPDAPTVVFEAFEQGDRVALGGLGVERIGAPGAELFVFSIPGAAIAYLSGDEIPDALWQRLSANEDLRALLVPLRFGDYESALAHRAHVMTPKALARAIEEKLGRAELPVLITNLHPRREPGVEEQAHQALGNHPHRFLQEGDHIEMKDPMAVPEAELTSAHFVEPASSLTGGPPVAPDETLVIDASNAQKQTQIYSRFGRHYNPGEKIFAEGDQGAEMFIIQEGQVKLYKVIRGEKRVLETLGAGEFFGEMAILNHKPRSLTAEAATPVKLLIFPPETFEGLVVSNSGLAHKIIRTLAGRLERADNHIENLLYRDSESKLVNALLKLVEDQGIPEDDGFKVSLVPKELAERVSLSTDQVKRVMARLAKSGIVKLDKKSLHIPDVQKLEKTLSFLSLRAELNIKE